MRARVEDVTWRNVEGQIVILDLRDSSYLRTNATGAMLWERMQRECASDDLVALLVESFEIDPARASEDVAKFLDMMASSDLLIGSV